jgi:hypothetical protein
MLSFEDTAHNDGTCMLAEFRNDGECGVEHDPEAS